MSDKFEQALAKAEETRERFRYGVHYDEIVGIRAENTRLKQSIAGALYYLANSHVIKATMQLSNAIQEQS